MSKFKIEDFEVYTYTDGYPYQVVIRHHGNKLSINNTELNHLIYALEESRKIIEMKGKK